MECVTAIRMAVLINGSTTNEFCLGRGLRQGDPVSPFLFILVTEVLHLLMVKAGEIGLIKGIQKVISRQDISHLKFTKNTILFLKVDGKVVENIKYILCYFEMFSRLTINFKKSCIMGFGVNEEFLYRMATICKCQIRKLPFKYLVIALGADLKRVATWDSVERFRKKLSGWKCKTLSWVARIVLVNEIFSSLPIYFMSLFQVPVTVIKKIDKIRRNFLWDSFDGKRKMVKLRWNQIYRPKEK